MRDIDLYCMCLNDHHLSNIKKQGYIPVGLGNNKFSSDWIRDNTGVNISNKNPNYGEYTFYYWFWKNILPNLEDNKWAGFCGYRYHWAQNNKLKSEEITKIVNQDNFQNFILSSTPKEWNNYDLILGEQWFTDKWKLMKILKKGKKFLLTNPFAFLKKNRNIKLHFDFFHGKGILDQAINALDDNEKEDFRFFTKNKKSFNRENLFICRSKKLMDSYFQSVFKWLEKCEQIEDINKMALSNDYASRRIYAFLAERYLSYWFQKYGRALEWPIFFFDTNKFKVNIK